MGGYNAAVAAAAYQQMPPSSLHQGNPLKGDLHSPATGGAGHGPASQTPFQNLFVDHSVATRDLLTSQPSTQDIVAKRSPSDFGSSNPAMAAASGFANLFDHHHQAMLAQREMVAVATGGAGAYDHHPSAFVHPSAAVAAAQVKMDLESLQQTVHS